MIKLVIFNFKSLKELNFSQIMQFTLSAASLQLQKLRGRPQAQKNQQTQPGGNSLSWTFPADPVDLVRELPVNFQLQQPNLTNRFAVRCGNDKIDVEVSQDLLGLGRLAAAEEVTLGHCSPSEVDDVSHVLVFESKLHECGSTRLMTDDAFIYAFELLYNPKAPENSVITRSQRAAFQIQCHYTRSGVLFDWSPYYSSMFIFQYVYWNSPRISNRYGIEDVIRIQASVVHRGPLKVLLDHCISTVLPAPPSEFDEAFVKNHGCLGGRLTGPTFMARPRPDELQFQIKASSFPLQKMVRLIISPEALSPLISFLMCNGSTNRWRGVNGNDPHCSCCAATCGMRKARWLLDDDDDHKGNSSKPNVTLSISHLGLILSFVFNQRKSGRRKRASAL
uniref:Zona pellucida sperm-binding protein 3 n=1 Tax=Gouania willdenowi TaxID=441366 RepID=A0A8C5G5S4_GOUWI